MLEGFSNASRIPELRRRLLFTAVMLAVYRARRRRAHAGNRRAGARRRSSMRLRARCSDGSICSRAARWSVSRSSPSASCPTSRSRLFSTCSRSRGPISTSCTRKARRGAARSRQYTRYGTVGLAVVQGSMIAVSLEQHPGARRRLGGLSLRAGASSHHDRDHGHRGLDVRDVDRRADHRARNRQRHLADHHGGNRRAAAERASAPPSQFVREGEMSMFVLIIILLIAVGVIGGNRLCRDRRSAGFRFSTRGAWSDGESMAGRVRILPLKINTVGRHSADFRLVDPGLPGDGGDLSCRRLKNYSALSDAGRIGLRHRLRRPDRLLLLFLHGGHLQSGRRCRQSQEVWRLHPGHPAGTLHRRIYRSGAVADNAGRRDLRQRRMRAADAS